MSTRPDTSQLLVNIDAERAILGKLIIDDRQWWEVSDRLKAEDFGEPRLGNVYAAIAALVAETRRVSVSGLMAHLGETKTIDQVSASAYLYGLLAEASGSNIASVPITEFADVVLHRSGCRRLVAAAEKIKAGALKASLDEPIEELRQAAGKLLVDTDVGDSTDDESIGALISKVVLSSEDARKTGKLTGLRTGFLPFDELVGPLFEGQVIVIAGETGSGKTALATQLGIALAEQGIPGRMTSMEMQGYEIATRVLATHSAVRSDKIFDGDVTQEDIERMMRSGEQMFDLPFWIDSTPKQSVGTMQARYARAIKRHGVQFGIIDHVQYAKSDLVRGDERERITQVVDDLKGMAKRLRIVLFVISHISRQVDFATIKTASDVRRPTLNSLFGSSAIEKAADATVFVHRPHWFLERATPTDKKRAQYEADLLKWEGQAELVLPKRRGGKGFGVRQVYFNEALTWFSEQRISSLKNNQLELLGGGME